MKYTWKHAKRRLTMIFLAASVFFYVQAAILAGRSFVPVALVGSVGGFFIAVLVLFVVEKICAPE
jgi:hypothetical protein